MSSLDNENSAKIKLRETNFHDWTPKQMALINEVKSIYNVSKTGNPLATQTLRRNAWKIISAKTNLSGRDCSSAWHKIMNKYTKLYFLLQSGKVTQSELSNKNNLKRFFDGSLKFLDIHCAKSNEADLPASIHKWGDNILHKCMSSADNTANRIITHDQVKEMLLNREVEIKNNLDIEDEDIHYLRRTIQNLINYKLNVVINGTPNTLDDELHENTNNITKHDNVTSIHSKSRETTINKSTRNKNGTRKKINMLKNKKKPMKLLHSKVMLKDDTTEGNIEETTTNESMEVKSTINKDDACKEYMTSQKFKNVMEENIEGNNVNERTMNIDDAFKENMPLESVNLHSDFVLLHDIKKENIEANTVNESTINKDNVKKRKKKTMNLHSKAILTDDIQEENVEDITTNETMEVESTINKDDIWEENRLLKNNKAMKLLHSEVTVKDEQENIVVNSIDETMEVESTNLHSEVILTHDIKEENFEDDTTNESMEVESNINKDDAWQEGIKTESLILLNNAEEDVEETSVRSNELDIIEEINDKKVEKFFKDLGDIMSLELCLEKQEELKSRINEVLKLKLFTCSDP